MAEIEALSVKITPKAQILGEWSVKDGYGKDVFRCPLAMVGGFYHGHGPDDVLPELLNRADYLVDEEGDPSGLPVIRATFNVSIPEDAFRMMLSLQFLGNSKVKADADWKGLSIFPGGSFDYADLIRSIETLAQEFISNSPRVGRRAVVASISQ